MSNYTSPFYHMTSLLISGLLTGMKNNLWLVSSFRVFHAHWVELADMAQSVILSDWAGSLFTLNYTTSPSTFCLFLPYFNVTSLQTMNSLTNKCTKQIWGESNDSDRKKSNLIIDLPQQNITLGAILFMTTNRASTCCRHKLDFDLYLLSWKFTLQLYLMTLCSHMWFLHSQKYYLIF